jgi:hypothetical protein
LTLGLHKSGILAQKLHLDLRLTQKRHFGAKAAFGLDCEVGTTAAFLRKSGISAQKQHFDLSLAQKRRFDLRLTQKRHFGAKAALGLEFGAKAEF